LLRETGTLSNLTTDAHLASLAIADGAAPASCDTDFRRFTRLRWENPAAETI
jgi:predicted nucleic acid-binding protein